VLQPGKGSITPTEFSTRIISELFGGLEVRTLAGDAQDGVDNLKIGVEITNVVVALKRVNVLRRVSER
jgi:hypothetical protein